MAQSDKVDLSLSLMAVLTELRQQRLDRKVWKAGIELKGFCTMESDEDGGERQYFGKS